MTESACTRILGLEQYEALGRLLGGGDFFGLDGQFIADDGGKVSTTEDPMAVFTSSSVLSFTPMMFDGTSFDEKIPVRIGVPFDDDAVLSPSGTLVVTRVSGPGDA